MNWGVKILLGFILLISACKSGQRIPENVLQPEEMKKVMWDVFLAEAWANQSISGDSNLVLSDKVKEFTQDAFEVNKMTEEEFFKSYNWYINHPDIFNVLLDSLQKSKSDDIHRPEITPVPLEEDEDGHTRPKQSLWISRDDLKAFP